MNVSVSFASSLAGAAAPLPPRSRVSERRSRNYPPTQKKKNLKHIKAEETFLSETTEKQSLKEENTKKKEGIMQTDAKANSWK